MSEDTKYIVTQQYDEVRTILPLLLQGHNVMLLGEPGQGKSSLVGLLCDELWGKKHTLRPCSPHDIKEMLIEFPLIQGGSTVYQRGQLLQAMLQGRPFFGDEMDEWKKGLQNALSSVLDHRRTTNAANADAKDAIDGAYKAQPGFIVIGAYNPKTSNPWLPAFVDRFRWAEIGSADESVEQTIMDMHVLGAQYDMKDLLTRGVTINPFGIYKQEKGKWAKLLGRGDAEGEIKPYYCAPAVLKGEEELIKAEKDKALAGSYEEFRKRLLRFRQQLEIATGRRKEGSLDKKLDEVEAYLQDKKLILHPEDYEELILPNRRHLINAGTNYKFLTPAYGPHAAALATAQQLIRDLLTENRNREINQTDVKYGEFLESIARFCDLLPGQSTTHRAKT